MGKKKGVAFVDQLTYTVKIISAATILFVSFIVCLAVQPSKLKKIIGKLALGMAVGGLILYSYGYANQTDDPIPGAVAVMRATIDSLRVFVGQNNWDDVKLDCTSLCGQHKNGVLSRNI